jgi:hypothetical protein
MAKSFAADSPLGRICAYLPLLGMVAAFLPNIEHRKN